MSDIIYYKNGEETYRISPPTVGNKCPETKLEIKMTETDIAKVLIEGDYATIMGIRYKRVEEPKTPVEESYKEIFGIYPKFPSDVRFGYFKLGYESAKQKEDVIDGDKEHKTIRGIIDRWKIDSLTSHSHWSVDECLDDLADQIQFFIMRNKK